MKRKQKVIQEIIIDKFDSFEKKKIFFYLYDTRAANINVHILRIFPENFVSPKNSAKL